MLVLHAGKEEFLKKKEFKGSSAEGLLKRVMVEDKKGNSRKAINRASFKYPLKAIFSNISKLMEFNIEGSGLDFEKVVKVLRDGEVIGVLLLYTSKEKGNNTITYACYIKEDGTVGFLRKGLKNREATRRKYRDFVEKLKLQEATT